MNKFLFLILILSSAQFAQASDLSLSNAGFVPANIWYSKDPFYAGDTIRVYTILFNGSTYDLTGNVEFFDNGSAIGKTKFSLAGGGRVQDAWVNWTAINGAHTITARLTNVVADGPNGKQPALLDNIETGKSERSVDVDPAVAAKESAAQLQKVTDAKNVAIGKIGDIANTVGESIPAPVKEGIAHSVNIIENFRLGEAYKFQLSKENKAKDISALKASTTTSASILQKSGDVAESISFAAAEPFAYVMLAIYTLLQYVFQWQVLFYGFILYAVYRLIKWVVGKIRNRKSSPK